ncbi:hypothetical protein TNCV_4709131 [Trichonephila clavipes]|nr:hypothetical protein TNCV_4709131 [Trichonephila clavipes]
MVVVANSWPELSSFRVRVLVTLKTHPVEELMRIKSIAGLVWKFREGMSSEVTSSSFYRGSKLRSASPIALVVGTLYSSTIVACHAPYNLSLLRVPSY